MMNYEQCAQWLRERDSFLIVTHVRPDGDTLGSASALCSALRRAGKSAALFNNPEITEKYKKYCDRFLAIDDCFKYVIAVDVADVHMLCNGFKGKVDLCIDHHPSNPHYSDELLLHSEKASCGEIVLEVIKSLCGSITPEEASLLYIAVSTDCGCFRYANVTHETFSAASELAKAGAEIQKLNFELFRQASRSRIQLEGMISAGLKFCHNGSFVIATVTESMMDEAGATENDCDDIAGIPGKVEGCIVSAVIREIEDGKCKVSLRSQPSFDSKAICEKFGGGGHKMAAGFTIKATADETLRLLCAAVDEVWE